MKKDFSNSDNKIINEIKELFEQVFNLEKDLRETSIKDFFEKYKNENDTVDFVKFLKEINPRTKMISILLKIIEKLNYGPLYFKQYKINEYDITSYYFENYEDLSEYYYTDCLYFVIENLYKEMLEAFFMQNIDEDIIYVL